MASRTTESLVRTQLEYRCVELRIAGLQVAEIARRLEVREGRVEELIDSYFERNKPAGAERLRTLYVLRYEMMWNALVPRLQDGNDDGAVVSALKILEALRKLMGVDKPQEVHAIVEHLVPDDIKLRTMVLELEKQDMETAHLAITASSDELSHR
jgi:hypothetical protein